MAHPLPSGSLRPPAWLPGPSALLTCYTSPTSTRSAPPHFASPEHKPKMIKGFRDFILRGNVVDLAVAVIIGAGFTAIVTSLVTNIITPLLAAIVGKPDFSALTLTLHGGVIQYGSFLNSVISFALLAAVVYFFIVVPMNYVLSLKKAPAAAITTRTCPQCLSEIPLAASRCKFCAQPV